jgi:plasmid stabilization system protein ParE
MPTIYWTDAALDDLDGIFDLIAKDAPAFAQSFVQAIMQSVGHLQRFPQSGRTIPEAEGEDEELREVIFQGYRIMYCIINEQRIDVIAVMHGSRDLSQPEQQPWKEIT